jgi:hypothetical protein
MSVGRMVAALAVALCFGAVVASLAAATPGGFVVFAAVSSFVGAIVIAAVLTGAVVAVQALWTRSLTPPAAPVLAVALIAGGLVMYPVHMHFYQDAEAAAEGGPTGSCTGVLTLAQVLRNTIEDEAYGEISYFASCED